MIPSIYGWKPYKDKKLRGLAVWLMKCWVSANMITLMGLLLGLGAAGCLALGQNRPAIGLLCLSIGADILDGTVARLANRPTYFGKIWDSICDRLVETAMVGALVCSGMMDIWALLLLAGSLLLLGCRILAHRFQIESSFVIVTRFERMTAIMTVVIMPGLSITHFIYYAVTVGTFVSSGQIMLRIMENGNKHVGSRRH